MKLSDYARQVGVSYKTAWRWFRAGKIRGYQMDTGTVIVTEDLPLSNETVQFSSTHKVAIYAHVTSPQKEQKLHLQAQQLENYCHDKGWQVDQTVKEIRADDNETRPKLLQLLADPSIQVIVVEGKEQLMKAGFDYIETLLRQQGRWIEVVNPAHEILIENE